MASRCGSGARFWVPVRKRGPVLWLANQQAISQRQTGANTSALALATEVVQGRWGFPVQVGTAPRSE